MRKLLLNNELGKRGGNRNTDNKEYINGLKNMFSQG